MIKIVVYQHMRMQLL